MFPTECPTPTATARIVGDLHFRDSHGRLRIVRVAGGLAGLKGQVKGDEGRWARAQRSRAATGRDYRDR